MRGSRRIEVLENDRAVPLVEKHRCFRARIFLGKEYFWKSTPRERKRPVRGTSVRSFWHSIQELLFDRSGDVTANLIQLLPAQAVFIC